MKILAVLLLGSLCAAQELKRPTADMDAGALTVLGCFGTNQASGAMPLSWDSPGQTTFSSLQSDGIFGTAINVYKTRIFKNWASPDSTYTSLSLNINALSDGNSGDTTAHGTVSYSIDGGSTWVTVFADLSAPVARHTYSIMLGTAQDFSNLRVALCVQAAGSKTGLEPGSDRIAIYDIWTAGQSTGQAPGTGSSAGARHNAVVVN